MAGIQTEIRNDLNNMSGKIIFPEDYLHLGSPEAVHMALSRLTKERANQASKKDLSKTRNRSRDRTTVAFNRRNSRSNSRKRACNYSTYRLIRNEQTGNINTDTDESGIPN